MVYRNYIIINVIIIFGLKYYYIYLILKKTLKQKDIYNPVFSLFESSSRQRKITLKTVLGIPSVCSQLGGLRRGQNHDRLRFGLTADQTTRC